MILIISNAEDATADFIEKRLDKARVRYHRLNTEVLARVPISFEVGQPTRHSAALATCQIGLQRIALGAVTSIYYRRPVPPRLPDNMPRGTADWIESELRRTWGGMLASQLGIRWVNHPLAISGASYKPEQLVRAQRMNFRVPETLITTDPEQAEHFCAAHAWSVIAKPVGHGEILGETDEDDRIVYTNRVPRAAAQSLKRVTDCPTLFQREIAKDVDIRVTVVDRNVIAVALHSQERALSAVDCRRNNMTGMRYSLIDLPRELEAAIADLVASYGLLYAAVDLVLDQQGRYWFLELNPAGQWAWLEQLADAPISEALIRCLSDA